MTSLAHVAFFCYGCRDPNVAAIDNFEHVPLQATTPDMAHNDFDTRSMRSRAGTHDPEDLVEIDLGKKVQIIRVQHHEVDSAQRSPPRTPAEEQKRQGMVGLPPQLTPASPRVESSPFLDPKPDNDWI